MGDMVKLWLSLSLSGGILILVLRSCGPILKEKFSRSWQYYVWLLVIVRLLIPFGPEQSLVGGIFQKADYAAAQWVETAGNHLTKTEAAGKLYGETELVSNSDKSISTEENMTPQDDIKAAGSWGWLIFWIWFGVVNILLIRKIMIYRRFVKFIKAGQTEVTDSELLERFGKQVEKSGIHVPIGLYRNPSVSSPLLIGFFRPRIVLPTIELAAEDFKYTIQHELTHFRRGDMFYKWLVQITLCLHWFNPLVYMMEREINRACELSCDEAVLKCLEPGERRAYGDTLFHAAFTGGNYKNSLASVTLSENKALLKERLGAIMNYKKKSKMITALTLVLTMALAFGATATGAYASTNSEKKEGIWGKMNPDGNMDYAYTQDGYYQAPYIMELGWNLNQDGYKYYPVKSEVKLENGDSIMVSFDESCASSSKDETFLLALKKEFERLNARTSKFAFPVQTPLVLRVQDVSGRDLSELAREFYAKDDLTSFSAIFGELGKEVQKELADRMFEESQIAFYSCSVNNMDDELVAFYMDKAYREDKVAFLSVTLPYLSENVLNTYVERAYEDSDIAFFTVLYPYLSEEKADEWVKRAKKDNKNTFLAVLREDGYLY